MINNLNDLMVVLEYHKVMGYTKVKLTNPKTVQFFPGIVSENTSHIEVKSFPMKLPLSDATNLRKTFEPNCELVDIEEAIRTVFERIQDKVGAA